MTDQGKRSAILIKYLQRSHTLGSFDKIPSGSFVTLPDLSGIFSSSLQSTSKWTVLA